MQPVTSECIAVTLVGGYLGSGKTTLINHVLRLNTELRIAVLVNDFGTLAIDAALIDAEEDNIISLSGGCVCCSYGNDLGQALLDVRAMQPRPDHVIVETSGVAIPAAIAASVSLIPGIFVNSTIVLVNAELIREQASDRYVGDTIDRQLHSADLLIVNKTDLVDQKQLSVIQNWLVQRWPEQRQISVQQAQLPLSVILDSFRLPVFSDTNPKAEEQSIGAFNNIARRPLDTASQLSHALLFHTYTLDLPNPTDVQALLQILTRGSANIIRAKGYVNDSTGGTTLLQVVGQRGELTSSSKTVTDSVGFGVVCIELAGSESESYVRNEIAALIGE